MRFVVKVDDRYLRRHVDHTAPSLSHHRSAAFKFGSRTAADAAALRVDGARVVRLVGTWRPDTTRFDEFSRAALERDIQLAQLTSQLAASAMAATDLSKGVKAMSETPVEAYIQAKNLTFPRVTPAGIEASIECENYFTAAQAAEGAGQPVHPSHKLLTICVLVMKNGYTVLGKSACASPENFDAELGRKIARQDAVNQCWPLLGYELRTRLANG